MVYNILFVIIENLNDKLFITRTDFPNGKDPVQSFNKAKQDIVNLTKKINKPLSRNSLELQSFKKGMDVFKDVKSNTNYKDFKNMVEKAKKLIYEGEIFQVVLSRIFKKKIKNKPLSIYRALRHLNPSPYLFYEVIGSY